MIERHVRAKRHPPSTLDRLLDSWASLFLAVLSLKQGALALFDVMYMSPRALSILAFPVWQAYGIAAFMLSGSLLWGFTILYRFETLSKYLLWQRFGLGFTGLAWAAFMVASVGFRFDAVSVWTTSLICGMAVWGLYIITYVYERRVRTRYDDINSPGAEEDTHE